MIYVKISNKQIFTKTQIRNEFQNVLFPEVEWTKEMIEPFGFDLLHEPDVKPTTGKYEMLVLGEPILVNEKWTKQYKVVSSVPTSPELLDEFITKEKAKLKDQVTSLRYSVETNGITLPSGERIATDVKSQIKISGALAYLTLNPTLTIDWKGMNGWTALNYDQVKAIANAVGLHVQGVFSNEKQHHDAIDALTTVQELEMYDINTGWASNI